MMSKSSDDVIPPAHAHRTLVLCFDGTYNQFHEDNSNVVQLFDMLKKDDPSQQVVYYQAGMPLTVKGKDLDAHILGGYEFLMQNCELFSHLRMTSIRQLYR